jgi:hypothetical protein
LRKCSTRSYTPAHSLTNHPVTRSPSHPVTHSPRRTSRSCFGPRCVTAGKPCPRRPFCQCWRAWPDPAPLRGVCVCVCVCMCVCVCACARVRAEGRQIMARKGVARMRTRFLVAAKGSGLRDNQQLSYARHGWRGRRLGRCDASLQCCARAEWDGGWDEAGVARRGARMKCGARLGTWLPLSRKSSGHPCPKRAFFAQGWRQPIQLSAPVLPTLAAAIWSGGWGALDQPTPPLTPPDSHASQIPSQTHLFPHLPPSSRNPSMLCTSPLSCPPHAADANKRSTRTRARAHTPSPATPTRQREAAQGAVAGAGGD